MKSIKKGVMHDLGQNELHQLVFILIRRFISFHARIDTIHATFSAASMA